MKKIAVNAAGTVREPGDFKNQYCNCVSLLQFIKTPQSILQGAQECPYFTNEAIDS